MNDNVTLPQEVIMSKIYMIRGQKIMLDRDLSELYQVETKQLKRQVRRNITRFPADFMFKLTKEEYEFLRSQFGTLNRGEHSKYAPMVFTEQGVSMLSSVLNSQTAINLNIQIIRTFTKMREMILTSKDLLLKMEQIEKRSDQQDESIEVIFRYLKQLISLDKQPKKELGYKPNDK
ncbi:MAG: ORF6N domain-containing protein [Fluviicola sp.]|nr:ORF6N domain-containing protein [Fluviicola sp.]